MQNYQSYSITQLRRRLADLDDELRSDSGAGARFMEHELLVRLIDARKTEPTSDTYIKLRGIAAIELALDINGRWMTRDEIVAAVVAGGMAHKPESIKGTFLDLLAHHCEKKRLVRHGNLYGRAHWKLPEQKPE